MRNKIKDRRKALFITFSFLSMLVVISLFLFSLTTANTLSSTTYDKIKYDNQDLKVIFEDEGIEKGDILLVSHTSVDEIIKVGAGWQVTMEYLTNFKDLQTNVLQDPIFLDLDTGEIVDRQWKYVQYIIEERERDKCTEYEQILLNDTNSTNETYINGECLTYSKEKYMFEGWEDYNSRDIPKGASKIGLMVYNLPNDRIDGIWKIGGNSITKHAGWESSYQTDLVSWYKLDETSGTNVDDAHGTNDLTIYGNLVFDDDYGKINGAIKSNSSTSGVQTLNISSGILPSASGTDYSFFGWMKTGTVTDDNPYLIYMDDGTPIRGAHLQISDSSERFNCIYRGDTASIVQTFTTTSGITFTNWNHYGCVKDGTTLQTWVNGVNIGNDTVVEDSVTTTKTYMVSSGTVNRLQTGGAIDEVGIWERALSSEEVGEIYQLGVDGYSYGDTVSANNVQTLDATSISSDSAVLNGNLTEVTDWGNVFFQYRKT